MSEPQRQPYRAADEGQVFNLVSTLLAILRTYTYMMPVASEVFLCFVPREFRIIPSERH